MDETQSERVKRKRDIERESLKETERKKEE
jgi:hypothetical protein